MAIEFIVPAKASSSRVPNKNWRPFVGDDSLVDYTIRKLLAAGAGPKSIYVSCDGAEVARPVCERWGVSFLERDSSLCDNEVPLTTWIRTVTAQVPGTADIAWCQVCDPLFNEYRQCLDLWGTTEADSLVVCYPWKGYLMTGESHPVGWSFGEHHTPSQQLPKFRTMPFTFSILTRQAIAETGYHVGRTPLWYEAKGPHVDIDTEIDFTVAQMLVQQYQGRSLQHPLG